MGRKDKSVQKQHWSWTFSYYLGLLLVLWINMQLFFLKEFSIFHFAYSMLGVLIIVVTHLPSRKKDYEMRPIHKKQQSI